MTLLQLHLITPSFPISLNSVDLAGERLLSPRGSQITTTTVAGTGLPNDHDARAMLDCVEIFFCFFDQGIGSRSAAWASRVDVI